MKPGDILKVGEGIYGRYLNEYTNGYETTAGFVPKDPEPEVDNSMLSITYDSEHFTELPVPWPRMLFLDDRNKRLRIKEIAYDKADYVYIMEDGYASRGVTE